MGEAHLPDDWHGVWLNTRLRGRAGRIVDFGINAHVLHVLVAGCMT